MVMIVIRPSKPVYILLMKDDTGTPIHQEKFESLLDAQKEMDILSFEYPQAKVILLRQENGVTMCLFTRNPMRV
jgi:hypothetical protein